MEGYGVELDRGGGRREGVVVMRRFVESGKVVNVRGDVVIVAPGGGGGGKRDLVGTREKSARCIRYGCS